MTRETLEAYRTLAINGESVGVTNDTFVKILDLALASLPHVATGEIVAGSRVKINVPGSWCDGRRGVVETVYENDPSTLSVRLSDGGRDSIVCRRDELEVLT